LAQPMRFLDLDCCPLCNDSAVSAGVSLYSFTSASSRRLDRPGAWAKRVEHRAGRSEVEQGRVTSGSHQAFTDRCPQRSPIGALATWMSEFLWDTWSAQSHGPCRTVEPLGNPANEGTLEGQVRDFTKSAQVPHDVRVTDRAPQTPLAMNPPGDLLSVRETDSEDSVGKGPLWTKGRQLGGNSLRCVTSR